LSNVAVRVDAAPSLLEVGFNPQTHGHKPCKDHGPFTEVAEGESEPTHTHQGREVEQVQGAVGESFHHVWSILCLCVFVCVSEVAADAEVHHTLPIDVVSVHRRSLQRRECAAAYRLREVLCHEGVDVLPSGEGEQLGLKLLLERCACVCHVCHVSVYLSAGRNRTSPSTMCACLCVAQRQSSKDTSSAAQP